MLEWLGENWEYVLIGFYIAEKIVKETKCEWDDILVDGIKSIFKKLLHK